MAQPTNVSVPKLNSQRAGPNWSALNSALPDDEVIITYNDLPAFGIRFTRVHINRLIAKGEFPAAIRLSTNRIGWSRRSIRDFVRGRSTVTSNQSKGHTPEARAKMRAAWERRRVPRTAECEAQPTA
jgi:hypothetical protein